MTTVNIVVLENGFIYPTLYYDGSKKQLNAAIEAEEVIAFTDVDENGTSIERNINSKFIVEYCTTLSIKNISKTQKEALESNKLFFFPTAGFVT